MLYSIDLFLQIQLFQPVFAIILLSMNLELNINLILSLKDFQFMKICLQKTPSFFWHQVLAPSFNMSVFHFSHNFTFVSFEVGLISVNDKSTISVLNLNIPKIVPMLIQFLFLFINSKEVINLSKIEKEIRNHLTCSYTSLLWRFFPFYFKVFNKVWHFFRRVFPKPYSRCSFILTGCLSV